MELSRNMNDEHTVPADAVRINLRDFYELSYWAEKFGVSRERIIRAVHTAGPSIHDVQRELIEHE